jgi:hypothetical protein
VPFTSPEAISNRIRLSNEFAARVRSFIAECGTVDPLLSAAVNELPPDEEGIAWFSSQDDLLAGADEEASPPSVGVASGRIVPFIHGKAVTVSILGQPP